MTFQLRGEREYVLVIHPLVSADHETPSRDDPRDDRGRRRAEPAAVRDPICTDHLEPARRTPESLECGTHGLHNQVSRVARHTGRAHTGNVYRQTWLVHHAYDDVVVQRKTQ